MSGLWRKPASVLAQGTHWLMPYDLYERHAVVERLLGSLLAGQPSGRSVLDVGGQVGLLENFVDSRVVSINSEGIADLHGRAERLPFLENAFTAVVSLDTLEHLPRENRRTLVEECLRVAKRFVIVAAPFGSEGHREAERRLDEHYRSVFGEPHRYLSEHVRFGLPDKSDLEELAAGLEKVRSTYYFAGSYTWQCRAFERAILARGKPRWRERLLRGFNRLRSAALFHRVRLTQEPLRDTNRFYWVLEKLGAKLSSTVTPVS